MSTLNRFERRTALHGLAALAAAAGLALSPAPVHAQSPRTTVSVGIVGTTVEYYPIFVGDKKGFFERNGIKVDVVTTGSSARSIQMTSTDALNIGSSSWLDAVRVIDGGASIKVVANSLHTATTMLIGAKNIKSIGELKGKRVTMGGAKDITTVWWKAMAQKAGFNGEKDVDLVFGGGTPARFAALAAGGVEAAAVATPLAFKAIQDGFNNLGLMGGFLPDVPYMCWQANANWATANRDVVARWVRANNQAIAYIFNPANRNEAAQVLAAASNVPIEEALRTHDLVVEMKGFATDSAGTAGGVQGIIKVLTEFGDIKAAKPVNVYYDDSFVRAAATN